ncbi:MAG: hypothetical protein K2X77_21375, partial [Candidatus Obscuribacterales bacterium]|nr:hypothetical protein [Candidatus Obscuribacterales bacterium]
MNETKRDMWKPLSGVLLVFLILGLCGITFFFWRYDDVFPAASIDLKLSKQEIAKRAGAIAESMGYPIKDTVQTTTFYEESSTSTFLEYEYTMREANALMKSTIPCWLWYTRICKPEQLEEFKVWLTPDGRLDSVSHEIERERALPSISHEEAMRLSLQFVQDKAGVSLADLSKDGEHAAKSNSKSGIRSQQVISEAGKMPALPGSNLSKPELPKAEKSSALAGSNLSKPELPKAEKSSALAGSNLSK